MDVSDREISSSWKGVTRLVANWVRYFKHQAFRWGPNLPWRTWRREIKGEPTKLTVLLKKRLDDYIQRKPSCPILPFPPPPFSRRFDRNQNTLKSCVIALRFSKSPRKVKLKFYKSVQKPPRISDDPSSRIFPKEKSSMRLEADAGFTLFCALKWALFLMILGYSVAFEVNQYNFISVPFINLRNCKLPFDRMWFHLPKRHLRGFEQNKRRYCVSLHLRKSSIGKCVVARASIMPAHPLRSCKSSFTNKSKSSFYILKQFKIASFRSSLGSQSERHPQGIAHARSLNSESFFNLIPTVVSLVSKKRENS